MSKKKILNNFLFFFLSVVIICCADGKVYGIDLFSGRERWVIHTGKYLLHNYTSSFPLIVATLENPSILWLISSNMKNNTLLPIKLSDLISYSPLQIEDNIYIATKHSRLFHISPGLYIF